MYLGTSKQLTERPAAAKLETRNGRAVCPICRNETQTRVLPSTELKNFPLYCKRCRQTSIVNTESLSP